MKNNPKVYFISGSSGVGKTSVIMHLKKLLPLDKYDIRDFDERGVPPGGGPAWHDGETLYWLEIANENSKDGKSTIICGFQNPERFRELHNEEKHIPAHLFLLHASPNIIRKRLLGRHSTSESIQEIERASGVSLGTFIENMILFAPQLLNIFQKANFPIIETDTKTPEEIASEVVKLLSQII